MGHPNVGGAVRVRFLIRAGGMARETRAALKAEGSDMLLLRRVAAEEHVIRGRVLTLLEWLRLGRLLYPTARWLCKADDDAYIVTPDWEGHLRLIDRGLPAADAALHGYIVWHNWDAAAYLAKSFSFSYSPGLHWQRAIRFLQGDTTVARHDSETRELERCRERPFQCQHCTAANGCVGPFPFTSGWLFSLTAPLADAVASSAEAAADIANASSLPQRRPP
eukprot:6895122-Prymnesium_polylepis.1